LINLAASLLFALGTLSLSPLIYLSPRSTYFIRLSTTFEQHILAEEEVWHTYNRQNHAGATSSRPQTYVNQSTLITTIPLFPGLALTSEKQNRTLGAILLAQPLPKNFGNSANKEDLSGTHLGHRLLLRQGQLDHIPAKVAR